MSRSGGGAFTTLCSPVVVVFVGEEACGSWTGVVSLSLSLSIYLSIYLSISPMVVRNTSPITSPYPASGTSPWPCKDITSLLRVPHIEATL